jgi:hypothetical protein
MTEQEVQALYAKYGVTPPSQFTIAQLAAWGEERLRANAHERALRENPGYRASDEARRYLKMRRA